MRMHRPCEQASALILTLWCVAVLSITVIAVARMVKRDVDVEGMHNRRFEARELALTGIAYGMNPQVKKWDPLLRQEFPDGSQLEVAEISESSRLDINRMLKEPEQVTLRSLFTLWGAEREAVDAAVDSLVDWTDGDDLRSLHGAEKDDLVRQNRYTLPANRDFYSVAEMERVQGMDVIADLNPNWREAFTVYGGRRVDIQDASLDILQVVGGMSEEKAIRLDQLRIGVDEIRHTRDDFLIKDVPAVLAQLGLASQQAEAAARRFGPSAEPTRIESVAVVGGTAYRITAVVNRTSGGNAGIISWEEQ